MMEEEIVDYEKEQREFYARQNALQLAVSFNTEDCADEDIIARAEAFYSFVKGN